MSPTKTGTYTGTGAALNISLGWTPDHVTIENVTDGDNRWEWSSDMSAGHALQTIADGTKSRITANGVTAFAGTAAALPKGFTIGTALSEAGKVFRYTAHRTVD